MFAPQNWGRKIRWNPFWLAHLVENWVWFWNCISRLPINHPIFLWGIKTMLFFFGVEKNSAQFEGEIVKYIHILTESWGWNICFFWWKRPWVWMWHIITTLPETNSSPQKMMVSNRNLLFQGSIFRRYVSFWECSSTVGKTIPFLIHHPNDWVSPLLEADGLHDFPKTEILRSKTKRRLVSWRVTLKPHLWEEELSFFTIY